jgi:nitrogen regulatory protein P-II 1
MYRGSEISINLLPKVKVETVVKDNVVDELIKKITALIQTGAVGDGKIFIYSVDDAVRIRTGERGENAL